MSSPTVSSGSALHKADRVGFIASFLCAIHCALLPVLFALLPILGLELEAWLDFDQIFVVFATLLSVITLSLGWQRHRLLRPCYVLVPGLMLLWLGAFGPLHAHGHDHAHEHSEVIVHAVVMTLGGFLLAGAHLWNMRLTRAHAQQCGCHTHCDKAVQPSALP